MADDLHYVPGDFYRIDDRTGFKVRARKTRMEWNGLIVSRKVWEARQPQDFVKGVIDDQTVPMPRPRQPNTYLSLGPSKFEVYGDMPNTAFLVQNTLGYNAGINSASGYTNSGTAQMYVYKGTIAAVTAASFPSNIT
ncbi:MAG: hypothetical protein KGL39_30910 [Patescibacteria group bacterium]|nr:hypothetical protein [Patescibacteria group bacterium]